MCSLFELHIFFLFDSGDPPLPCSYDMRISRTFVSLHFPLNEMEGGGGGGKGVVQGGVVMVVSLFPFLLSFPAENNFMNEKTIRFFLFSTASSLFSAILAC
jgi:hypothetical protein